MENGEWRMECLVIFFSLREGGECGVQGHSGGEHVLRQQPLCEAAGFGVAHPCAEYREPEGAVALQVVVGARAGLEGFDGVDVGGGDHRN